MSDAQFHDMNGDDVTAFMVRLLTIEWDETGRIVARGLTSRAEYQRAKAAGERIMAAALDVPRLTLDCPYWVDASGLWPVLKRRPTLDAAPSTLTPTAGEEIVIAGVPAGTARFSGPISGSQAHAGPGALAIGWTVPGAYSLTIEAWPYRSVSFDVEVRPA